MNTLRFNGERWYVDRRSLWKRVRTWFVWVGGWEEANGAGWRFRIPVGSRRIWMTPTPVSFLGHRLTIFGHWFDFRVPGGVLVVNFRERHAYISRDGTPSSAHHWLWGYRKSWEGQRALYAAREAAERDALQEAFYAARATTEEGR